MTVQQQLLQELKRLQGLSPFASGLECLEINTACGRVQCDLTAVESLGCAFQRLSLLIDSQNSTSIEDLKLIGETLSRKLSYLMEPISPIEIDHEGCTVQLRSNPPRKDEQGLCYYELLVRRDELSLRRFQKTPASTRRPIEAHVTSEVLVCLVDDLTSVIPVEHS